MQPFLHLLSAPPHCAADLPPKVLSHEMDRHQKNFPILGVALVRDNAVVASLALDLALRRAGPP